MYHHWFEIEMDRPKYIFTERDIIPFNYVHPRPKYVYLCFCEPSDEYGSYFRTLLGVIQHAA